MTQAKSKTATKATATETPAVAEETKATEAPAATETPAVAEETKATEAPAATETPAAEEAKASGLDMIAVNTVGNHAPGARFTAKDKAAFDRFISLGAAKKA